MNSNATRSTARVVRLADLDDLHRPPPAVPPQGPHVFPDAESAQAEASASSNDSVAPSTGWGTVSSGEAEASRTMHPIGSTLPGSLSGPEVAARPWGGADAAGVLGDSVLAEPDAHFPVRDVPRLPQGEVLKIGVHFDAKPREYAKVWWGNVALLLLTLGLAWPWALHRRERYFLRHTRVASHRLDFRLPGRVLWPRYATMLALWAGVAGAMSGSVWAGLAGLSLGCTVWPLMAYLKTNQRVASLTWAGRRLWFDGTWQGLTRVMLLPMALAVGVVWAGGLAWHLHSRPWGMACAALVLAWLLCAPRAVWTYYRYRQQHLRLGPLRLQWKASWKDVTGVFLRGALMAVLTGVLTVGAGCMALAAWLAWRQAPGAPIPAGVWAVVLVPALAVTFLVVRAYVQARMLNLVWNHTGNRHLRFRARLPVGRYVRLSLRHALWTMLTLGLHHPEGAVALRGMRLRAVRVASRVDPDTLLAYWSRRQGESPPTVLPSVAASLQEPASQSTQPSVAHRRAPSA